MHNNTEAAQCACAAHACYTFLFFCFLGNGSDNSDTLGVARAARAAFDT